MGTLAIRSKDHTGIFEGIFRGAPSGAISAHREYPGAPWQFTTKADIRRAKKERMVSNLYYKRECRVTEKRCLYVWVFFCPGISGVFFRGWYTYLVGLPSRDYDLYYGEEVRKRLLALFPYYDESLFSKPHKAVHGIGMPEEWMQRFVKAHQRGKWGGKGQGKAPLWADVCDNQVTKIYGRAEWPDAGKE